MFQEYAIEPACLADWNNFRYVIDGCGFATGRIISRFPGKWLREVAHAIDANSDIGPVLKKSMKERLLSKKRELVPGGRSYDGNRPWLENACEAHQSAPFHGIVTCSETGDAEAPILPVSNLSAEAPDWCCESTFQVRRTAAEMAAPLKLLLQTSKEIIFVDPHFDVGRGKQRWHRPLQEMLRIAVERPDGSPVNRLEYHFTDKTTVENLRRESEGEFQRCIPLGLTLNLITWPKGALHNRYVLTELGGVMFGAGLDEALPRQPQTDDVSILSKATHDQLWEQYKDGTVRHVVEGRG